MRLEQTFSGSYQYYRTSGTANLSKFEASVKGVRDRLRAKFETNTSGAAANKRIYVSSIVKWNGSLPDYKGYGFVIKIGVHQWFFMFFGSDQNYYSISNIFQSIRVTEYWRGIGETFGNTPESNLSTSSNVKLGLHYNSGSGSYALGLTDTTTMRRNVGGVETDFLEPSQNPYIAADSFMPGIAKIKGIVDGETVPSPYSIVVDNEKPFVTVYIGNSNNILNTPVYSWIFGNIVVPTNVGDNGLASFRFYNNPSSPTNGGLTVYHPTTGAPTGYDISYDNGYDLRSMWTNDTPPKLNFKSVQVIKAGLPQKGFIDTDVVRVAGPNNFGAAVTGNLIMNTPTGPLTCLCGDLFTPWGDVSLSERYGYFVDYPVL